MARIIIRTVLLNLTLTILILDIILGYKKLISLQFFTALYCLLLLIYSLYTYGN